VRKPRLPNLAVMQDRENAGGLESLSADHVLTMDDIGLIADTLLTAPWSYAEQDGNLLWVQVVDRQVRTAGELRDAARELEPFIFQEDAAGEPDAESAVTVDLAAAIRDVTRDLLEEPLRELVRMRVRFGALVEILEEKGITLGPEYSRRYRENLERDFHPLFDSLVLGDAEEFRSRYADWIAERQRRERRRVGDDVYEELRREWQEYVERERSRAIEANPGQPS
jgi:hypothetical protein